MKAFAFGEIINVRNSQRERNGELQDDKFKVGLFHNFIAC